MYGAGRFALSRSGARDAGGRQPVGRTETFAGADRHLERHVRRHRAVLGDHAGIDAEELGLELGCVRHDTATYDV
ncbi:hypothetical protein ESP70_012465 [Aeromicrobium ginsengisoli]|uniref:Uncharacterized protein n=1 Tax=Aeromicrobium ginsengisoli TaxID=363867 RepID=A0A5M4FFQ5_9ACTN|nr:hypothetical protein ESP70_012465 [Aeromicrobium ginsengisoli]